MTRVQFRFSAARSSRSCQCRKCRDRVVRTCSHVHRSLGAERQYCWADPLLTRCKFARGGDHAIPTARWSPVHPAARHRTRISAGSVPPPECARSHRPCCCQPEPQQPDTVTTCVGRLVAACPGATAGADVVDMLVEGGTRPSEQRIDAAEGEEAEPEGRPSAWLSTSPHGSDRSQT